MDEEAQADAKPPPTKEEPGSAVPARKWNDAFFNEAYEKVPEIGAGWRWYDPPHKALDGLFKFALRIHAPRPIRRFLVDRMHWLSIRNHLQRQRVWSSDDAMHNLHVPLQQHVSMPSVWVVEFFLPSTAELLRRSMERGGWDSGRLRYRPDDSNESILTKTRTGAGWHWWRVGTAIPPQSKYLDPDALRTTLPLDFERVEVTAYQVGSGLTALIAHFSLTDDGARALDREWHADHGPRIVRQGKLDQVEDRKWRAFHEVQSVRARINEHARAWMQKNFEGAFAALREPQPMLNLVLFRHEDDDVETIPPRDAMRAVGILEDHYHLVSEHLSGLVLEQVDYPLCKALGESALWTLWGDERKVARGLEEMIKHGGASSRPVSHAVEDTVADFFLPICLSALLQLQRRQVSFTRDLARSQHGKFKRADVESLRAGFLTASLDTVTLARDVTRWATERQPFKSSIEFWWREDEWSIEQGKRHGFRPLEPRSLDATLREDMRKQAQELVEVDRDQRDILGTVASLGASIDSFRTQRYAVWIALLSLLVALASVTASVAGADATVDALKSVWDAIQSGVDNLVGGYV